MLFVANCRRQIYDPIYGGKIHHNDFRRLPLPAIMRESTRLEGRGELKSATAGLQFLPTGGWEIAWERKWRRRWILRRETPPTSPHPSLYLRCRFVINSAKYTRWVTDLKERYFLASGPENSASKLKIQSQSKSQCFRNLWPGGSETSGPKDSASPEIEDKMFSIFLFSYPINSWLEAYECEMERWKRKWFSQVFQTWEICPTGLNHFPDRRYTN